MRIWRQAICDGKSPEQEVWANAKDGVIRVTPSTKPTIRCFVFIRTTAYLSRKRLLEFCGGSGEELLCSSRLAVRKWSCVTVLYEEVDGSTGRKCLGTRDKPTGCRNTTSAIRQWAQLASGIFNAQGRRPRPALKSESTAIEYREHVGSRGLICIHEWKAG